MNEDDYKAEFAGLTKGMEMEKIYDALADRAECVRVITMHCGEIYKAARQAGLPRGVSERMAMSYFDYEVTPSGVYVAGGEGW